MSYRHDAPPAPNALAGSVPAPYRGPHDPSLPPPPSSYAGRHMPPPSSPPAHHRHNNSFPPPPPQTMSRDLHQTSTPAFPLGRDLPAPAALNRPGSSMSISSMLGTDAPPSHHPPHNMSMAPAQHSISASPQQPPNNATRPPEYPSFRRAVTPDSHPHLHRQAPGPGPGPGPRDHRAHSAGTPPSMYENNPRTPDHYQGGPPPLRPSTTQHSYAPVPPPSQNEHYRTIHPEHIPPPPPPPQRPSSQPANYGPPMHQHDRYVPATGPSSNGLPPMNTENSKNYQPDPMEREVHQRSQRMRLERDQRDEMIRDEVSRGAARNFSPSAQPTSPYNHHDQQQQQQQQRQAQWMSPTSHHASPDRSRMSGQMMGPSPPTVPFPSYATPPNPPQAPQPQPREAYRANESPSRPPLSTMHHSDGVGLDRRRENLSAPQGIHPSQPPSGEPLQRKNSEDSSLHAQRALLGVNTEAMRRGRISPLPQAVQGAQGQIGTPGAEPGIKSEFGRMFSGIGSGLGTPTPSPMEKDDKLEDAEQAEVKVAKKATRKRKAKEEDKISSSSNEGGRGTPVINGRGGSSSANAAKKRGHNHHHHHRHAKDGGAGPHHHHHHHHSPTDGLSTSPFPTRPSAKRVASPSLSGHHHHHHHHHHHANSAAPTPAPPFIPAKMTIISSPLLQSMASKPRRHLGSTLYSPRLEKASRFRSGFGTTTALLPKLEGKENCLLTVRVSRTYLAPKMREVVTRRRAVWGSEVYTDDSDPLAVAIHGGYIRGEWGPDVDVSLLGLENPETVAGAEGTLEKKPAAPVVPPDARDAHITLLVLPPLSKYEGTVQKGIRSRTWGSDHDGMSFSIFSVTWVNEGSGAMEERTGLARRKRLKEYSDASVSRPKKKGLPLKDLRGKDLSSGVVEVGA